MATAPSSSSPSSPSTAPSSPATATSLPSTAPSSPATATSLPFTAPSSPATATSLPFIAPSSPSSPSPISNVIAFHHHRLSSPSLPSTAPSSSSPSFPVFTSSSPPPSSPSLPVFTSSSAPPSSPVTSGTNTTPPPSSSVVPDAVSAVQFLSSCHRHKARKGTTRWLRSDVKNPESIADHTYGKSMMALIAPDVPGLDRNKCIRMAIIHDTAEVLISDMTGYVPRSIVRQREQTALYFMCRNLGEGEGSRGNEITELWMEYEANSSLEAKFVRDLDKIEMLLQVLNSKGDELWEDLDEFLRSTAGKFQTEIGKAWATEIVSSREN